MRLTSDRRLFLQSVLHRDSDLVFDQRLAIHGTKFASSFEAAAGCAANQYAWAEEMAIGHRPIRTTAAIRALTSLAFVAPAVDVPVTDMLNQLTGFAGSTLDGRLRIGSIDEQVDVSEIVDSYITSTLGSGTIVEGSGHPVAVYRRPFGCFHIDGKHLAISPDPPSKKL